MTQEFVEAVEALGITNLGFYGPYDDSDYVIQRNPNEPLWVMYDRGYLVGEPLPLLEAIANVRAMQSQEI